VLEAELGTRPFSGLSFQGINLVSLWGAWAPEDVELEKERN
jgi:hypothetical protein